MANIKKKLSICDTQFRHGLYTSNPNPIARVSKYMEWDFEPPLNDNDIQIVYTETSFDLARTRSKNNIGWIIESPEYHKSLYQNIKYNYKNFKHIITHDKELLDYNKKFKFCPMGGSWLYNEDIAVYDKTKNFSIIASWKSELEGHRLRHKIVAGSGNNVDIYGTGYNPIERKITALKDYRYSFCIENCKKDYYFTEKLIDCFLSGTIPIYWGCPSIGDFFNTKGMIIFDSLLELKDKLKSCTKEFYEINKEYIIQNYKTAHKYLLAEDYIFENKKELLYAE
jgi:hypothetical protein